MQKIDIRKLYFIIVRMEHSVLFEEQVSLNSNDLSRHISSVEEILLKKVKAKLENKCSRYGFVLPGTITMLSRSLGKASSGRFVADYLYQIQVQGKVINPPDGTVLNALVIRKNKMGIYLNYKDALRIIIPRDLHIGDSKFEAVQIGDTVSVEIKKSRFQINDETILSVGIYLSNVKASAVADNVSTVEEESGDEVENIGELRDDIGDADEGDEGEADEGEADEADEADDDEGEDEAAEMNNEEDE